MTEKKRYDFLLLDADDTIFDFLRCEESALKKALDAAGLPSGREIIDGYSEINLKYWKMLERREITKERLMYARFEEFAAHFGFDTDTCALAEGYASSLAYQHFLFPGALECCRELAKDRELYIITNGIGPVQEKRISDSGLMSYVKDVFISDYIGAVKPSPEYFRKASERIPGFDREAALVVGDSLSSDIRGGIGAGIDVCWVNPDGTPAPDGMKINYVIDRFVRLPGFLESIGR